MNENHMEQVEITWTKWKLLGTSENHIVKMDMEIS
jgi:hypothetical protein